METMKKNYKQLKFLHHHVRYLQFGKKRVNFNIKDLRFTDSHNYHCMLVSGYIVYLCYNDIIIV